MSIPLVGKVVSSPARSRAFCFSSTGFDKDPSSLNLALYSAVSFYILYYAPLIYWSRIYVTLRFHLSLI